MVYIAGKQFKVTKGDVIIIEGYWPPTAGDKISLDKVYFIYCLTLNLTILYHSLHYDGLKNIFLHTDPLSGCRRFHSNRSTSS